MPRPQFTLRALLATLLFVVADAAVIPRLLPECKATPFFVGLIGGPSTGLAVYFWMPTSGVKLLAPRFSLKTIFVVTTLLASMLAVWLGLSLYVRLILSILVMGGWPAIVAFLCLRYGKYWRD
jgi:hypothetical protein